MESCFSKTMPEEAIVIEEVWFLSYIIRHNSLAWCKFHKCFLKPFSWIPSNPNLSPRSSSPSKSHLWFRPEGQHDSRQHYRYWRFLPHSPSTLQHQQSQQLAGCLCHSLAECNQQRLIRIVLYIFPRIYGNYRVFLLPMDIILQSWCQNFSCKEKHL